MDASSFLENKNIFIVNEKTIFKMISFGGNAIVSCCSNIMDEIKGLLNNEASTSCFDVPILCKISSLLSKNQASIGEIYDFFIPSKKYKLSKTINCNYNIKRLSKENIILINNPNIFDNALCENNTGINEFAYAAYENDKIVSICGASSNTENLWWVGVDTVVEHRGQGLASLLANKFKNEVLSLNKKPIYPTWYANILSRKTAISSDLYLDL